MRASTVQSDVGVECISGQCMLLAALDQAHVSVGTRQRVPVADNSDAKCLLVVAVRTYLGLSIFHMWPFEDWYLTLFRRHSATRDMLPWNS